MKKTILAVMGAALLAMAAMISMGYGPVAAQQSGQQGASQSAGNETGTAQDRRFTSTGNVDANNTRQLHAFLDTAIIAAKNNDTLGMMTSLSQIMEGLGNLSNPVTQTAGAGNETMTSGQAAGNQTDNAAASSGAAFDPASNTSESAGGSGQGVEQQVPSDYGE